MKKLLSVLLCIMVTVLPLSAIYADAAFDFLMKEKIYSPIYLLTSLDDSTVVLSKNADKKTQCPALNKILTVALTLKYTENIDKKITITQKMLDSVGYSYALKMGLKVGEEISIKSLLYAIMLYGANDACAAVAVATSSDVELFLETMNSYVASLGCKDTVLKSVMGFDANGQYTTAKDISVIMADVVKIPLFMEIFGAKTYTVEATNLSSARSYVTGNRLQVSTSMYYYSYVSGGKSGATEEAGYCTISTATKDGYTYLAVVLKGDSVTEGGVTTNYSMADAKTLFKWAFNNIKFKVVATQSQIVSVVDVIAGSESDHVSLSPAHDISTLVPALADENGVLIEPIEETMPEKLLAPVKKGDVICEAKILYAGEEVARVELVAAETVNLSVPRLVLEKIKDVLKSKIFIAVLVILAALILIYIVFVIFDNIKSKRNRVHIVGRK